MEIIILQSALKHGITEEDIFKVITQPTHEIIGFEPSRRPNLPSPNLHIGQTSGGIYLEVFSYVLDDCIIFHAMKLRGKIYAQAIKILEERKNHE